MSSTHDSEEGLAASTARDKGKGVQAMKTRRLLAYTQACALVGLLTGWVPAGVLARPAASDAPYQQDGAKTTPKTFTDMRAVRFCEIFFIQIQTKGEQMELNVYNPTGLNDMAATRDSCPDKLLNKVDLEGLKRQYKLDAIYLNKPRDWMFDELKVPVGAVRNFYGMDFYWMAASHFPKGMKFEPGFLPYKRAPVERKTETMYQAGKPVFLLDDPDGKVWVMKAFRDSYGQTAENLKDLGGRYKNLPAGWKFRVATLKQDLILRPTGGIATVMQDEFENTFDYMGDGSSNHVP
jgi:hypothetical protein